MNINLKKMILCSMSSIIISNPFFNVVNANENDLINELNAVLYRIENDNNNLGVIKTEDIEQLENVISRIEEISSVSYDSNLRGNQWVDLGAGYRFRLDSPESNGNPNYHVHVYKNGKEVASQNVDGSKSHGSTLDDIGSSKIKKKIEDNSKYKDAQKKQEKLKKGKDEVKKKYTKSQLKQQTYIILAKGIMISALGYALFSSLSLWGAFFAII